MTRKSALSRLFQGSSVRLGIVDPAQAHRYHPAAVPKARTSVESQVSGHDRRPRESVSRARAGARFLPTPEVTMSRTVRALRIALVSLVMLGAASTATAADDDFEFAQALARRGYVDLAKEKYESLGQSAEGQLGLALLRLFEARVAGGERSEKRREPFVDVLALFDQADQAIAGFIKRFPSHKRTLEARLERARLLQQRADYVKLAIEEGWTPADQGREKLLEQVAKDYDAAIGLLRPVQENAEKQRDAAREKHGANSREYFAADDEFGLIWLFRIVALYGKGAALPPGNAAGQAALNQVVTEVEDFLWDYETSVRGVWALQYRGLANWKLENATDAYVDVKEAATYIEGSDFPAARDVSFKSFQKLAEVALDLGQQGNVDFARQALTDFEKLELFWPNRYEDAAGQRAALAHAKVLIHNGRVEAAVQVVQKVLESAARVGTGVDREAGSLLGELLGSGASIDLPPTDLARVANAYFQQEKYNDAIRAFRAVIDACHDDEGKPVRALMDEHGWTAWDQIGVCYGIQRRYYEAFLAFDRIEQAWAADKSNEVLTELTDETGHSRYKALEALSRRAGDDAAKARYKTLSEQALTSFAEAHPNSPYNQEASSKEAETKVRDMREAGRGFLRGNVEAGEYVAAIDAAEKAIAEVPADSTAMAKMKAYLTETKRRRAQATKDPNTAREAIALAEAWLAKSRPDTLDSSVRRARANGRNIALLQLLTSYADLLGMAQGRAAKKEAASEWLTALDKHQEAFLEAAVNGDRQLSVWRTEALIATDQLDEAERLVLDLMERAPEHANTRYLAGQVAKGLENGAESRLNEFDDKIGAQGLFRRAAILREFVVSKLGDKPEYDESVAKAYQRAGEFDRASELYEKALAAYQEAGKEEQANNVRIKLIDLLIDRGKYDEAIPQLEARLVEDPGERARILGRLKKDTSLTVADIQEMLKSTSRSTGVLDALSRAYLEAKTRERLIAAINTTAILLKSKKEKHDEEWVRWITRYAQANYQFGLDYKTDAAFDAVINTIQNGIITPGYLENYDELVPGTKKKLETLLRESKTRRGR